ncbi:amino acid ABC transporter substrate-binding protein [Candidatus Viridilinea mediisalina]|uniref:Amino acid ABC transporter substrate-binding protein n=2 Tax=Candidatus Viridilinea mediisalina TaxID=2024553 RepID=A0A2A6RFJ1_9CHLR|nr:amino acid ABC transporter substrate-binding protein [Candidatus Viridilinea mediisalina]
MLLALLLSGCGDLLPNNDSNDQPAILIVTATPEPGAAAAPVQEPTPVPPAPSDDDANETPAPSDDDANETPAPSDDETETPTAPDAAPAQTGPGLLARVQDRGYLICGTNANLPGFGFYDNVRNDWFGFDVDFCRALAAAIFGDASKVDFVGLTTAGEYERFGAVRQGRVDVLFRNTSWTLGRDVDQLAFGPTTFHDGQSFMVRRDAGVSNSNDLAGRRICVAAGTTSEQTLNEDFAARGIDFEAVLFNSDRELYPAYDEGECDAVTSDSSQLASQRETLTNPDDHVVLDERISREPLGPVFIENDDQWRDVVSWVVFATMYAEELRVDQNNVNQLAQSSDDQRILRLLGREGDFGQALGLNNDFALQIISQVGNYGDIYDRNLGPRTPFALERGPNKAWNLGQGGVLASPPFR